MMRCQFKTCGMPAKWRVQIGPVQDGNACRKHAKHRPRIFKLTAEAEAEADLRFIRSALLKAVQERANRNEGFGSL